jgi:hypothetical protein
MCICAPKYSRQETETRKGHFIFPALLNYCTMYMHYIKSLSQDKEDLMRTRLRSGWLIRLVPHPSAISNLSLFLSLPAVSPVELTDGRGGGRGAKIIRLRESLVHNKLFNTLWRGQPYDTAYTPPGKNWVAIRLFVVFINKFLILKKEVNCVNLKVDGNEKLGGSGRGQ